ncbi:MAG: TonB-dependent receptor [Cellvibrio sp.]|uniref:TonB-dependent receptor family protein n=1 Tax=Cellvibrio sp. TaxID=1965322 RepID=UPI0031AFE3F3
MLLYKRNQLATYIGLALSVPLSVFAAEDTPKLSHQLETVLVIGQKVKEELEAEQVKTPGSVTLVDSAEFYQRNVANLGDMLRYVPGVWTASGSTGDSTFFSSRGSNLDATNYDGNGIKLLQDGLPVTAADGNNHNRIVDPLSTRYAVVAHGANALTYGASTLGGAIDFISPTARDTESEVVLNGGSHGQVQGRVTAGVVDGGFDGLLTVESKQWEGYRDHHEQERKGINANAGWQFNDAVKTRLYLTYIENEQELPGVLNKEQFDEDPYQAEASAVSGHYQYNVDSWRIANKTIWDINENSSLTVGISHEKQKLYHPIVDKVMVDFDGSGPNPPFEVFSLLINTEQANSGVTLRYNLHAGDHDLLAGLNYGETTVEGGNYRNDAGRRNGITTLVDNNADSLELFLVDRWQIAPKWKVVYGIQAVDAGREVKNTTVVNSALYNPKADYDSVNPRIGVIHQFSDNTEFFANISRLYEAPTNYELEDDISPDSKPLDAMRGEVIEIGARGSKSLSSNNQWRWDVAFYYGQLQDEILSVDDPTAPGTSLSTNVDDTVHAGIEALLGASFALNDTGSRIEPLLSVTINEFSFDNDSNYGNNELPAAPGYAIKGEILYRNATGFFVGPTFDIVDERYADFKNTYTIDSYALLGLRVGLTQDRWEIYGEARNVTNKEYVGVHTVRDAASVTDAILQAGEPRSFYVGAKFQF